MFGHSGIVAQQWPGHPIIFYPVRRHGHEAYHNPWAMTIQGPNDDVEGILLSPLLRGEQRNKNTSESCKQWHQSEPKHCQKLLKTKHQVPGLDVPRLTGASSSSRVQFPSCREQTGKPQPKAQLKAELNTNWRVIEAIATNKEVAGTINGSSCWLWL